MAAGNHYQIGERGERPWGTWTVIGAGSKHVVKEIMVNPGGRLSLQLHHGRDEHWVIVAGTAEVTIGDQVSTLSENQSVFIPVETRHRIANPGAAPLVFVEVQYGSRLDEADIVRFEDNYGRAGTV